MQRVASLADLDLPEVLGLSLSSEVVSDLLALAAQLDRLERYGSPHGWVVGDRDREVKPGQALPVVLDRTLSFPASADDSLELSVAVWQQDAATLLVDACVEVYCFCSISHNIHRPAELELTARTDRELRDGLTAAVTAVERWAALDLDADQWRARAGLPSR